MAVNKFFCFFEEIVHFDGFGMGTRLSLAWWLVIMIKVLAC